MGERARALAAARRSIAKPSEIAYYLCYAPATARLVDLAWTAGSRWHVEEAFQSTCPSVTHPRFARMR